jgi:hypothetical protein
MVTCEVRQSQGCGEADHIVWMELPGKSAEKANTAHLQNLFYCDKQTKEKS